MNDEPIDELYFEWLCGIAHRNRGQDTLMPYTVVSGLMHEIVFDCSVPNDDNRECEGRNLRYEFMGETDLRKVFIPESWEKFLDSGATLFEVLVALARRCEFQVELGASNWFFIFISNLHLVRYDDNDLAEHDRGNISRILNKLNNRTYTPSGAGGLFPLKHATKDQRKVELWYQMSAYIIENDMII